MSLKVSCYDRSCNLIPVSDSTVTMSICIEYVSYRCSVCVMHIIGLRLWKNLLIFNRYERMEQLRSLIMYTPDTGRKHDFSYPPVFTAPLKFRQHVW